MEEARCHRDNEGVVYKIEVVDAFGGRVGGCLGSLRGETGVPEADSAVPRTCD